MARARGVLTRAEDDYRRSLDISQQIAAADPSSLETQCDLAVPVNNLAGVLASIGDACRAWELFERNYNTHVQILGEDHPETLAAARNLRAQAGTRDIFNSRPSFSSRNPVSTRSLSAGGNE